MAASKKTKKNVIRSKRTEISLQTDNMKPVWSFARVDRDGSFMFDPRRSDLDIEMLVEKLMSLSSMTWQELKRSTHDSAGHTKHHYLSNRDRWSIAARERFDCKCRPEEEDMIFSFALNNKQRLIGLRDGAVFHIIWFDAEHQFYPVEH